MKISEYLKETQVELKHVVWPSRKQTLFYTLVVIILSFLLAYFLGIFDFLFSKGLEKIISLSKESLKWKNTLENKQKNNHEK